MVDTDNTPFTEQQVQMLASGNEIIREMYKQVSKERIKEEREYNNVRQVVTTLRCPMCGYPLKGWVSNPMYDTLDCKPHIQCTDGCGYFHAEGKWFSLYDKGALKSKALQELIEKVKPYIKVFGSPLYENY